MIKNNTEGKVLGVGYFPGKSLTMVRNPNWKASTDYRPAYLTEINYKIGGNITVNASAADIAVGGSGGCGGNTIKQTGTVQVNHAAVFVVGNSFGNNLAVQSNTPGPVNVTNNTVTGTLTCTGNAGVTSTGNTAKSFVGPDCH